MEVKHGVISIYVAPAGDGRRCRVRAKVSATRGEGVGTVWQCWYMDKSVPKGMGKVVG